MKKECKKLILHSFIINIYFLINKITKLISGGEI